MNTQSLRPLLAEFLGTALFVFVGAGSVIANAVTSGAIGALGIALAHGVGMAVIISALMNISGAHLNPAVSFGLLVAGKADGRTFGRYVAAQLAGAVVGAALLKTVFSAPAVHATSAGTPQLAFNVGFTQALVLEGVLTFFLVSAVFGTLVSSEAPKIGGFGVGLSIFVSTLVAGSLTGAALNPARALGPALISWTWHSQAVYWLGPLAGGGFAGWVWRAILLPKTS